MSTPQSILSTIPSTRKRPNNTPLAASALRVNIRGLIAEFELRHEFRNDTRQAIEAIFTIPVPLDAAFLGMTATLAGDTLRATVQPTKTAETRYDDAIDHGHSAVLLEQLEPGLLCLNLGNLKPGETGSITLTFATALACSDTAARLVLPLVHRPRYGRYHMEPYAVPTTDFAVEYPLELDVTIHGDLAQCPITCTHPGVRFASHAGSLQLQVSSAMLDRDLVVQIDLSRMPVTQIRWLDDGDQMIALLALFAPGATDVTRQAPIDLCLLLDCSGSMAGDAIVQSRAALAAITNALINEDRIHVIRFGSSLVPLFRRPMAASAPVKAALLDLQQTIDADLGGTEMAAALDAAVHSLQRGDRADSRKVIILVTDGAVQPSQLRDASAHAAQAGVRVFVVAVGSSAGVDALQPLADATQGVLERAVPAEPIDGGVMRHFRRARAGRAIALELGCPEGTRMPPMAPLYPGDAGLLPLFIVKAVAGSVRAQWADQRFEFDAPSTVEYDAAARAYAGKRLLDATRDQAARESIAMRYRLLSAETSAVLVKLRADANEVDSMLVTISVPHMVSEGVVCAAPLPAPGSIPLSRKSAPAPGTLAFDRLPAGGPASASPAMVYCEAPFESAPMERGTTRSPPLSPAKRQQAEILLLAWLIAHLLDRDGSSDDNRSPFDRWPTDDAILIERYLGERGMTLGNATNDLALLGELLDRPYAPELNEAQEITLARLRAIVAT
ncbi:hypothetical protein C7S18_11445 [Ahniella affigens]|uniref:VWFA domain-containing protein n=1 Tax=Ahniella affigens TaxID=2021234 RepID=A0A2P1PSF2_9GAMM|nr:VIT domain-containing protein [Ahniella affigens]AVP97773.1 hypothetical protein C7S18_11445 [Ahniella affigens]